MISRTALFAMLRVDGKRLARDQFMLGMFGYLFGLCIAMRFAIPWATAEVAERFSFDLVPYYPIIAAYLGMLNGAMLVGILSGFLLLETREDRTIRALLVTPVPWSSYVGTQIVVMWLLSLVFMLVQVWLIGVGYPSLGPLFASALLVAPFGPMAALFMASFADNRVEAFAQAKFVSTAALVPVIAWFLPEPWQHLAGVIAPYWGVRAFWAAEAGDPNWALWLLPGVLVSAIWLWALIRVFGRAARR